MTVQQLIHALTEEFVDPTDEVHIGLFDGGGEFRWVTVTDATVRATADGESWLSLDYEPTEPSAS